MKTRAAILVETGHPLVIDELELSALREGQVLVEMSYSGACHTQVLEARGYRGKDNWLPHCLGHEGTGTVIECGPGITKVRQGDRVVLSWIRGEGLEAGGATYDWNGRTVNAGGVTTFQHHAVVSENRLTHLPEGVPMDAAILLGCAAPTGMGSIVNVCRLQPGEAVAVFGLGGIGLNATMAAAFCEAAPIIGVDPQPAKRKLALRFGATNVLDPEAGNVIAEINEIVPGGVNAAIEATGLPAVMRQALDVTCQQGGRAVIIGNAHHGQTLTLDPRTFNQGKSLLGTWGGNSRPERDYGKFAHWIASGRFDIRPLLSACYRLEDINTALDDLESGTITRPVIELKPE